MSVDYESPPVYRTVSKENSANYEIPASFMGYNACIYDIESTGTLNDGENYPARSISVNSSKETGKSSFHHV